MRHLVDTRVFPWWMSDPERLSSRVASLLRERPHEVGFSSVSAWELAIKSSLGKVNGIPFDELEAEIEDMAFVTADRLAARYPVKVLW